MSQHYPKPEEVLVPFDYPSAYNLRKLKEIIARDGLIVPILVNKVKNVRWEKFEAADQWQGERVIACRELDFETILVETEWTEEDL